MQYRVLGRTGVKVSPLCLGGTNFGDPTSRDESIAIINKALDSGINFIDTSNSIKRQSESIVGEALKGNHRRNNVVLATKVSNVSGEGPNDRGASRYHIQRACEDSLRRLQTDHIDLYQLHRPSLSIPRDETLRALDDLVKKGKVAYIGCSTHPAWMVMESIAISERYSLARYVSEQPPYNLLDRRVENELIPLCQKYGLAVLPWSPLAGGILAGRYPVEGQIPTGSRGARTESFRTRITSKGRQIAGKVAELAQERGISAAQLALLWIKDQPGVTAPIIGPRTLEHLESFIPVMDMQLTDDDRKLLDALVHPGNAVADFHDNNDWMKARILD